MSGLFGGGGPKQSNEEKAFVEAQTEATKLGIAGAQQDIPAGRAMLTQVGDFFKKLFAGDRKSIFEAFQPEITQLHKQYETGRKTTEEFGARGGGRTALQAELGSREAGDMETLIHGARKEGAAGLMDIGGTLASLGTSELGMGGASAASGASREQSRSLAVWQQQQANQAAAGQAIGSIIALLVCWIAEEVYGKEDERTAILRYWLNHVWGHTFLVRLYRKYGQQVAAVVRRSPMLRLVFRVVFDSVLIYIHTVEASYSLKYRLER